MPQPIPVIILARLAVDRRYAGQNIGTGMLRDALLRTLQAADIAGIRALLVHALHERAAGFYRARGFVASPFDPLVLFLGLDHVRRLPGYEQGD
jgi:GNAT superfamily N-acetyltransferase